MERFVKKTFETIQKTINWCNICVKCNRSEKDLVGVSVNTIKNINIFSVEGLCIDCEIAMFPERFHGCGFCKRPIRERFCCTTCSNGFTEWINNSIHPINGFNEMIKRSASDLIDRTIYDLPQIENNRFILRTDDGYYKWPGFYGGITDRFTKKAHIAKNTVNTVDKKVDINIYDIHINTKYEYTDISIDSYLPSLDDNFSPKVNSVLPNVNFGLEQTYINQDAGNFIPVWIIPRMLTQPCFNVTDLKLELNLFQRWLTELLENNNIHLYDDVQIDADTINLEQVVKVNPFDTRVIKNVF